MSATIQNSSILYERNYYDCKHPRKPAAACGGWSGRRTSACGKRNTSCNRCYRLPVVVFTAGRFDGGRKLLMPVWIVTKPLGELFEEMYHG